MNAKMKKFLFAAAVVAVFTVLVVEMASAGGRGGRGHGRWDGHGRGDYGYRERGWDDRGYRDMPCDEYGRAWGGRGNGRGGWGRGYGMWGGMGYGYGRNFDAPEVPQEIRDKFVEAEKTAADLRNELNKTPVDRAKALELHAKHSAIMQEISNWRFQQGLDAQINR